MLAVGFYATALPAFGRRSDVATVRPEASCGSTTPADASFAIAAGRCRMPTPPGIFPPKWRANWNRMARSVMWPAARPGWTELRRYAACGCICPISKVAVTFAPLRRCYGRCSGVIRICHPAQSPGHDRVKPVRGLVGIVHRKFEGGCFGAGAGGSTAYTK